MKIALSILDDLFHSAEALGKRLGVSRSRLYATALSRAGRLDGHAMKDLEKGLRLVLDL